MDQISPIGAANLTPHSTVGRAVGMGPADGVRGNQEDQVHLSNEARVLSRINTADVPIRHDKVTEAQRLIRSGEYLSDKKLEVAADELVKDLNDLWPYL